MKMFKLLILRKLINNINMVLLIAFLFSNTIQAQNYSWETQDSGTNASIRGISAVNKNVCWLSGSEGTVARTTDGGKTWVKISVPNCDSLDFRDIEAFSADEAIIMSIGTGSSSRILKTVNGGKNWKEVFVNKEAKGFFDGFAFWNKNKGILMGDPIDGKLYILKTNDGGETWQPTKEFNRPSVVENEYAFAASGSHITVAGLHKAWIGTGGNKARVFYSEDDGDSWKAVDTEIIQGEPSTGIFSVAFKNEVVGVTVGGDYTKEGEGKNNVAITNNGGRKWELIKDANINFCSAVRFVGKAVVATGPANSYFSLDLGKTWKKFSDDGYHTMSIGNSPKAVWAAGRDGKVAKLKIEK
ncbi:WD40/YVTN/BNR-like repeat-containing protein [Chondrinema litorale]|uniref:WD40/YVTN/BNR-like repeat-containing protein n=1 Tax=Chondrinema litorale TaxID=2994555 RepID=UPI002542A30A|nr:YCF48-related protein [Chondrinema litorale]UZR98140.1 YCF48-related protein [Chondrinema litorale]